MHQHKRFVDQEQTVLRRVELAISNAPRPMAICTATTPSSRRAAALMALEIAAVTDTSALRMLQEVVGVVQMYVPLLMSLVQHNANQSRECLLLPALQLTA